MSPPPAPPRARACSPASAEDGYRGLADAPEPAGRPPTSRSEHWRRVAAVLALMAGTATASAGAAYAAAAARGCGEPGSAAAAAPPLRLPRDQRGDAIQQTLATKEAEGKSITLQGDAWEPMQIVPGRPLTKGPLERDSVALVLIDMQPLFCDPSSPWGSERNLASMREIARKQLALGRRVMEFTGRSDSVFLTRFEVPKNAAHAKGIMRHYYGIHPDWPNERAVTQDALRASGANVSYLLNVMPDLHPLVAAGAQLSSKTTAGAFGQDSTLPAQLDAYFPAKPHGTRTLIVAGVETDYCVLSTVLGAFDQYFRVVLVTDAISSTQPNSEQAQLDYTLRRFDHMLDLAEVQALLEIL